MIWLSSYQAVCVSVKRRVFMQCFIAWISLLLIASPFPSLASFSCVLVLITENARRDPKAETEESTNLGFKPSSAHWLSCQSDFRITEESVFVTMTHCPQNHLPQSFVITSFVTITLLLPSCLHCHLSFTCTAPQSV